jgi:hypothetical protein
MGVEVDEPRRDDLAVGVDRPAGLVRRQATAFEDSQPPVPDLDRAGSPGRSGPVDDRPANDADLGPAHRGLPRSRPATRAK